MPELQTSPCEIVSESYVDLVDRINAMRPSELDELRKQLDALAARSAFMAAYLEQRYAACGTGDQGHDKALKQANRVHRIVRCALGYHLTPQITF